MMPQRGFPCEFVFTHGRRNTPYSQDLLNKVFRKALADFNKELKEKDERLGRLPERARRTLTLDNGTENSGHEEITGALGTQCYFADPYASWQRGAYEQVNGMIRMYFPKGTDFSKITDEQVA